MLYKIFSLFLFVSFALCEGADIGKAAKSNNALASDLYQQQADEKGNLFFSPFSLSSALSIPYAGAKEGTAEQMAQVLHFDQEPGENGRSFGALTQHLLSGSCTPALEISNSLWIQEGYPVLPDYLELVGKKMFAGVQSVDYQREKEQARTTINSYVESATHGMIQDLVPSGSLSSDTRMVIVNTIYLKADWKIPFDPEQTYPQPFYLEDGSTKEMPMMHGSDHYLVKKGEGYTLLELPYAMERCGMVNLACYIALPDENTPLSGIEKRVPLNDFPALVQGMRSTQATLTLPKFSLETTVSMKEKLEALGMDLPFSCMADFSGINGVPELFISGILQKAKLKFEEKGTEASAATAVMMGIKCIPEYNDPVTFTADRPFMFVIAEKRTQTVLFAGRLAEPVQ
jgi:leukocyte elastase inhibitor